MSELLASLCLGGGLGALVLALWPRHGTATRSAAPPRLELDDGTPRTLH